MNSPQKKTSRCRSCSAEIVWLKTSNGRNMPADADTVPAGATVFDGSAGMVSHFATCPNASKHRGKGGGQA